MNALVPNDVLSMLAAGKVGFGISCEGIINSESMNRVKMGRRMRESKAGIFYLKGKIICMYMCVSIGEFHYKLEGK